MKNECHKQGSQYRVNRKPKSIDEIEMKNLEGYSIKIIMIVSIEITEILQMIC